MTEALATVAQRIIDMKKQVLADYDTLKRARLDDRLKELEEYAQVLAGGARSMTTEELSEILQKMHTIHADLRDEPWQLPDPETFLNIRRFRREVKHAGQATEAHRTEALQMP